MASNRGTKLKINYSTSKEQVLEIRKKVFKEYDTYILIKY